MHPSELYRPVNERTKEVNYCPIGLLSNRVKYLTVRDFSYHTQRSYADVNE